MHDKKIMMSAVPIPSEAVAQAGHELYRTCCGNPTQWAEEPEESRQAWSMAAQAMAATVEDGVETQRRIDVKTLAMMIASWLGCKVPFAQIEKRSQIAFEILAQFWASILMAKRPDIGAAISLAVTEFNNRVHSTLATNGRVDVSRAVYQPAAQAANAPFDPPSTDHEKPQTEFTTGFLDVIHARIGQLESKAREFLRRAESLKEFASKIGPESDLALHELFAKHLKEK